MLALSVALCVRSASPRFAPRLLCTLRFLLSRGPRPTRLCARHLTPPAPQYLNAIWNVINFDEAEKRYAEAVGGAKL